MPNALDLDAYFERIRFIGAASSTLDALERLVHAHTFAIPFENLDVWLRVPIRLDPASLFAKLVARRRGGYCFEHNTWLAAVLDRLGFEVTPLAARVRWLTRETLPRTHMVLLVTHAGRRYVVDGGFGGAGPTAPLRLDDRSPQRQVLDTFRVVERSAADVAEAWGRGHVVQVQRAGEWLDLYSFTLEPQAPADFVMANHFTQTYPDTRMTRIALVSRPFPGGRHILVNHELTIRHADGRSDQRLVSDAELRAVLEREFGIVLPSGAALQVPA